MSAETNDERAVNLAAQAVEFVASGRAEVDWDPTYGLPQSLTVLAGWVPSTPRSCVPCSGESKSQSRLFEDPIR